MFSIFTKSNGTFRNIGLFLLGIGEVIEQLPIPAISAYAGIIKVVGGLFSSGGVAKAAIIAKLSR